MNLNFNKLFYQLLLAGLLMPLHSFAQDGDTQTATFEDLNLEKESFWYGADLTFGFQSGSFKFDNFCADDGSFWGGFAYSNVTATEFKGYTDPSHYGNAVGCGNNGSANFAVINCFSPATLHVLNNVETGSVVGGFYITNSAVAFKTMSEGDGYARKFEQGDWLMLTIKEPETSNTVEYYLADFRSENEADHYILDTWQWVDLTSLGNVKTLEFQLSGSDCGDWGLNTPAYFCMDDFDGDLAIPSFDVENVDGGSVIDMSQYFTFDDNNATVTYTVEGVSEGCGYEFTVNGSDLEVKGNTEGNASVTIKAVKKGKVYYATLVLKKAASESLIASFDDLELAEESFWFGADLTYGFRSGSYKFDNFCADDASYWGGFAYSNVTDIEFKGYADRSHYGNAVGGGHDGTANFAVVNCFSPATLHADYTETLRGFYVTNSAVSYNTIINGDGYARKFEKGDWLMLTVTEPETGKSVDYYLADYRSENEAEHYALDTWEWVDLRELGDVKSLEFKITGSDSGDWGLNTPAYFCMDDFNSHRVITEFPAHTVESGSVIELSKFFTFDNNDAPVVYTIDEVYGNPGFELTVNGGNLEINGNAEGDFEVVIKAVKKGRVYFASLPLTVSTDIEGVEAADDHVTDIYTVDGKRVNSKVNGVNIIRTNNGNVKKVLVK